MADRAYQKALRAKKRGEEAPPAFDPDEALEIIGGPLAGLMAKFQRIIEDADGYHVEVDTDLTKKTRVSPAHVRKAG
jgi:transcription antitermination factor NusG